MHELRPWSEQRPPARSVFAEHLYAARPVSGSQTPLGYVIELKWPGASGWLLSFLVCRSLCCIDYQLYHSRQNETNTATIRLNSSTSGRRTRNYLFQTKFYNTSKLNIIFHIQVSNFQYKLKVTHTLFTISGCLKTENKEWKTKFHERAAKELEIALMIISINFVYILLRTHRWHFKMEHSLVPPKRRHPSERYCQVNRKPANIRPCVHWKIKSHACHYRAHPFDKRDIRRSSGRQDMARAETRRDQLDYSSPSACIGPWTATPFPMSNHHIHMRGYTSRQLFIRSSGKKRFPGGSWSKKRESPSITLLCGNHEKMESANKREEMTDATNLLA